MKRERPSIQTDQAASYDIRVLGRLRPAWSASLGGMEITVLAGENGTTITALKGQVVDQSALRSILNHIWDLNLTVTSVNRLEP